MTAKGTPAWYRRNDGHDHDHDAELLKRRTAARANGMFDEFSERPAFEAYFRDSRKGKGVAFLERMLERDADGYYRDLSVQRHWHTWRMSVGAGRLLPKFDPFKLAADRAAANAAERA